MIIAVRKGNLLDAEVDALVNTVNTVGVMGKGIALEFKKRFPEMFEDYQRRCAEGKVRLGQPYLYARLFPPHVINFPTKDHWRSVSRLEDVERGLEHLARMIPSWEVESLAVPPLGCGHGQLDWTVVGPTIYAHLHALDIPVTLFAPFEVPADQATVEFVARASTRVQPGALAKLPPAWLSIVRVLQELDREPYTWPVGRTRFQKLVYFAHATGIATGLDFRRGSYGPFADGLRAVLGTLVNNGLVREERTGRMIRIAPGPTATEAGQRFDAITSSDAEAIDRVVDLMSRLDGKQTEVAATVHFAANQLRLSEAQTPPDYAVLEAVMAWKVQRDPPFTEEEVAESIAMLTALGWLDIELTGKLPLDATLEVA